MKITLKIIYISGFALMILFSGKANIFPNYPEDVNMRGSKIIPAATEDMPHESVFDFDITEINKKYDVYRYEHDDEKKLSGNNVKKGKGC